MFTAMPAQPVPAPPRTATHDAAVLRAARRILLIGSGGAGKSTLARRLAPLLGLPLIHLDREFWQPGWVETPRLQWEARVSELISGEHWLMDGNFISTLALRLARADAALVLDFPRALCIGRALGRILRGYGRSRPDMTSGCPEYLDWDFLRWLWEFPRATRPRMIELLAAAKRDGVHIVPLSKQAEATALLSALGGGYAYSDAL
jgi:adenylate kinase family enzyme